ncbi:hypothetical protein AVEN_164002-1 [Araneus ventricosus]|uniref:Uncharacterized protein n=1 Tax=Araneus ventricosus TaxID=182803 RepID=A0A4Y2DA08_ARAVE|nr:hypothetical protein AVEN_164002-1 [Araneus ventricosus]
MGDSYRNQPCMARNRPAYLSDGCCNSSIAETGVLVAITDHGPTPPVGGIHYHRRRASLSPHFTYQGNDTPLTYRTASQPRTRGTNG